MSFHGSRTFPTFLLLTLGLLPATALAQGPPGMGFEVGEPFPTMAFPALEDGTPRSMAEFRGAKVILHVFASW